MLIQKMASFILLFASTRAFLRASRMVKGNGIPHQIYAAPPHLYPECGMCLLIPEECRVRVAEIFGESPDIMFVDQNFR